MNRLKIVSTDGKPAVLRIAQNPTPAHRALGLFGTWLRSPAEAKAYALKMGWTLAGKRQGRAAA